MSRIDFPKIYNPANQTEKELIENFVVRTEIFKEIFEDIKRSEMKYPEQHYIVQGVRGQGKTTLLLRIAYEIQNDKNLMKRLIPIVFNEEQYNISRLFKLWETVADYLEESGEITGLYQKMQELNHDEDYELRCFQLIKDSLKEKGKKIILFIDNIDDMLNKFSKKEHHRLREVFVESPEIRVIGASSISLEFHHDYGKPFYQFFKMPQLRGLTTEEMKTLLLNLGERYKKERVRDIVENQPGRVESLRRVTGGVIRTVIILFEIFVDDTNGNAFQDLEKILDSVTPLYKHRMDSLSAQQQEIVDFIALKWDAVSVKEIAEKTKLQSKAVSAQLKLLEKYHIIEKEKTDTKNYLYRIQERFFNIWYLMRLGRKGDESKVRFLVEFLQTWCDEKELEERALKHLRAMEQGNIYHKQAFFMTEALARTGIERETQYQLVSATRDYLTRCKSDFKDQLNKSDIELESEAQSALEAGVNEKAIEYLERIQNKTPDDLCILGVLYISYKKNFNKAKEYLLKAVEIGHIDSMFYLASFYRAETKDMKNAEKYYLMAVKNGHPGAMNDLGLLYQTEFQDYKKAEKYLLMSEKMKSPYPMVNLGLLYQNEFKEMKKAEKYFLKAVEKGNVNAMFYLSSLYRIEFKEINKAEKYYLMAVKGGHTGAMNDLGLLYQTEFKDIKKAENYLLMAVKKGNTNSMNNLALLYETEFKDIKKAEKYLLMAVEYGNIKATSYLAFLYETGFNDVEKAEKYFLMAMEKGNVEAINDLAWLYFGNRINKKRAIVLSEQAHKIMTSIYSSHTYSMILLWDNQIEAAYKVAQDFLGSIDSLEKFPEDFTLFLLLLMAKKQYHLTLRIFNENPHNLKDRFKPVYYALMHFMKNEFPNEYRKMGGEMTQTVQEIIEKVNQMEKDYN